MEFLRTVYYIRIVQKRNKFATATGYSITNLIMFCLKGENNMASSEEFMQYVVDQLNSAGTITYRKMFGEYGLYCNRKFFALVCDNQLFIKVTNEGQTVSASLKKAPPYEGAKPWFLISELDDKEFLYHLTTVTCEALPFQKSKKKPKS